MSSAKYFYSYNTNSTFQLILFFKVNSVILCGIETHACIRHTTMDLVENGFNVHVVVDACSSRSLTDRYQSTNFYSTTYLLNILNL